MPKIYTGAGINENNHINEQECSEGQNFELRMGDTAFRPRPPLDLKGTSTLAGEISGLMQMVTRAGTETTLVFEDDGSTPTIYSWNGAAIFTSKRTTSLAVGSKLRDVYWPLDETLIIVDISKSTPLLNWDGTTVTRHKTGLTTGSPTANTSITEVSGTYTVTKISHGYETGDLVTLSGVVPAGLNGEFEVTKLTADTFSFATTAGLGAAGTPGSSVIGTVVYAKYGIVHNGRLWLFNVKTDSNDTPHLMVASAFEDTETFDTTQRAVSGTFATGNEAFYIVMPDLRAINGVALFHNQLVLSTENGRLYRLTGSDASDYAFVDYYAGSAATGEESIANIGNDIVYMRVGGNIESLVMAESTGGTTADVETDDLSRFIPDTVKDITGCLIAYDQTNQKVHFFAGNKVIVLFKNLIQSGLSPWSVYKTNLTATGNDSVEVSAFNTNAVKYMRRPGETTYSVYFGDKSGNIWDLNGSSNGDNSTDIEVWRKSNFIDQLPTKVEVLTGRVQYRRIGPCELTLEFDWADEYNTSSSNIPLSGPPASETPSYYGGSSYYSGEFYYSTGTPFANKISTKGFSPTGRGSTFTMKQYVSTTIRFQIDHVSLFDES